MARPLGDVPAHGTRRRYQLRHDPCRCPSCTDANTAYVHAWRTGVLYREQQLPDEYLPRETNAA